MKKLINYVKEKIVFVGISILLISGAVSYLLYYYQSPEQCLVNELTNWHRIHKPNPLDDIKDFNRDKIPLQLIMPIKPEVTVAYGRVYLKEKSLKDLKSEYDRDFYIALSAFMEYCEIK